LSNVSRLRYYWWEEANQHIQTMRAVWPARPVKGEVTDQPSDQASPPERQTPQWRIDALAQSKETSTRGHVDQEMMVEGRHK
jgi:hypothetical protein